MSHSNCPLCMDDVGFMAAPDCYNDRSRNKEVSRYLHLENWNDELTMRNIISDIQKTYNIRGVSISLIYKARTIVKYENRLNVREMPRSVLIDGHCILSNSLLVLFDTTKDWRTSKNPLVAGSPYIRFYCGVHLKGSQGSTIGVLSIFDNIPRPDFSQQDVQNLNNFARTIMSFLNMPYQTNKTNKRNGKQHETRFSHEKTNITKQLGRATSRGYNLTIFDKDGSGTSYLANMNEMNQCTSKTVVENTVSSTHKQAIVKRIYGLNTIKQGAAAICRIIVANEKVDYACIYEVKVSDVYSIAKDVATKNLSGNTISYDLKDYTEAKISEKFRARMLGASAEEPCPIAHQYLRAAFESTNGIDYASNTNSAVFNTGVFLTFHKSEKSSFASRQNVGSGDIRVRSGGFVICVLNKSPENRIEQQKASRIFDYSRIVRLVYLY